MSINRKIVLRITVTALAAAALVTAGIWGYRSLDAGVKKYSVDMSPPDIAADGVSSAIMEIQITSRFGNKLNVRALPSAPTVEITEGKDLVQMIPQGDSLTYRLVAKFSTGTVTVRVVVPGAPGPMEAQLQLTASLADNNRNGYPDVMDLTSESDRTAFRRWFTAIAAGQLTHQDDRWHDRDCAGLLRYCYREALRRHDSLWLASRKWLAITGLADVRKYNYPDVPLVGSAVFNAGSRPPQPGDTTAAEARNMPPPLRNFSAFAEAARLKDNSLSFISRSERDALPGDVIIYLNDTDSRWPYHTMVYMGHGMTVYHTGPDGNNPGIVKTLSLSQLATHPNARWHPVAGNPFFLGFYRWKILISNR